MWAFLFLMSLSFEEAIDKALVASRQIKSSQIDAGLAKIGTLHNAAAMSPRVYVAWVHSFYDSPIQFSLPDPKGVLTNIIVRPGETSMGSLVVTQPLSPVVGLVQKIRADLKTQRAAEAGWELTRTEITFGSAIAYRRVQQLGELERIARDRVSLELKQEQDALAIYRAGRIGKGDLLRIQMSLGGGKVAAASLKAQYEGALHALKDLLGIELEEPVTLSPIPSQPILSDSLPEIPISERLDFKIANLTYQAAQDNNLLSIASFLPVVNAFARMDKSFTDPGQFGKADIFSAGFTLSWDIWDGGAKILNAKASSLMLSKAHLQLLTTTRKAMIDQKQTALDLEAAKEGVGFQKTTLEQAEEAYSGAFQRFQNGAISTTDLLQSELDLNNARVDWARALTDLDIKHMLLQKANGVRRPTSLL